ncbi:Ig-like domain-containing protein [uncultured Methanobrevibacter sp.]|uniref:Ig-like domain-containing protein n=1 Tax=uncultured Methanobrevibacter sp. TaxID=253161 RepID=UPI0025EA561A|nr:Ig-like domain-containing protein [uncultured Methanobrevibacter sp.]
MKKIFLIFLVVIFILSVNVSFADNNTFYVSTNGSDSLGDGSFDNPYQTINYTVSKASNNSNIYLTSGVYESSCDIDKYISITGVGDVSIDASSNQKIFKINENSSLTINNLNFVNGFADLDGEVLSPIVNEGKLTILNSTFNNFTTITGAIKNMNSLTISNVKATNLNINKSPYGEFVTNIGECDILNSNVLSSIYNNGNLIINDSYIDTYLTGIDYVPQNVTTIIDKSKIALLRLKNSNLVNISNSIIDCKDYHTISVNRINLFNSTFNPDKDSKYPLSFDVANLTAVSCVFNYIVMFSANSNINITYSTFRDYVNTAYYSNIYLNHNWWCDNKGPKIYKNEYSNIIADDWIVMTLLNETSDIIKVDFAHYTDGSNINDLENPQLFTPRYVSVETESGHFNQSTGYLKNSVFKAHLIDANTNTMIYATADNQVLRLAIGEGNTNYAWYVSDTIGNDYFYDGSQEYPYKTLKKAISSALSGNTIYINEGTYTLSWNANLIISKNLTFIGLDGAILSRPNNRNIFIVDEKGELTIYNLTFTTYTKDYYTNPLIHITGGNVNIKNSIFYDIRQTTGVISTEKQESNIYLDNVTFDNIVGSAINGNASNILINNSRFINGYDGTAEDGSYISVKSNLTILNSKFENSTQSMISINRKGYYQPETSYINIANTTFINNNLQKKDFFGLDIGIGKYFAGRYSVVDNCTFINNTGHLIFACEILNSAFINNTCIPFDTEFGSGTIAANYPKSLIEASRLINNSYFEGNSYISKSFEDKIIYAPNVYYSTFVSNTAAYGGALNNASQVHYCVFLNNTGIYGGNDLFLYSGNLDASSNWWGSNQKPDTSRIQVFIGNLTIDNWVIMGLDATHDKITATLDTLLDNNRNYHKLNQILPSREVSFSSTGALISPDNLKLSNNAAQAIMLKNTSNDFNVYAQIDNQIMSLTVYNNSTQIIIKNQTFYGKDNLFNITLININGHKISNQDLNIQIKSEGNVIDAYTLSTDVNGETQININYPIGSYEITVTYPGNGYFESTSNRAIIKVSDIQTRLTSLNYTYWGKNNKFYAILTDKNGKYILNEKLTLKIYDMKNKLISTAEVKTGPGGRADILLSLDSGSYKLRWDYSGNDWYSSSYSESYIEIKPVNTSIILPNSTIYGKGNDYKITFKDAYGTLISDETISLKISNATDSRTFNLKTEKGIASININLLPGAYKLEATYKGDDVYGPSNAKATLTINPVFITFDFNSHPEIPINGVFTVILKDMYGRKVSGENLTLELYDDGLLKTYTAITNAAGEADFKIDAAEGKYFGIINYDGNVWYEPSTGAATITISRDVIINNVYINANDFVAYYGENKYYVIEFNDTNAYSLEDKIINVLISSSDWSKSFEVPSDIFGKARLQITLDPGSYNITYKYSNDYYNIHAEGSNSIVIYKMPTTLTASNMIVNVGQARNFEVKLTNDKGNGLANLPVNITIDGKKYNLTTNANGIAKILVNLDLGLHNVSCSFIDKNYEKSTCNSTILVVDSAKIATNIEASDINGVENESIVIEALLTDLIDNPIASSEITLAIDDLDNLTAYTDSNGVAKFNVKLQYGNYKAKLNYNGNDIKLESSKTINIYVKAGENVTETILFGNDCEIINGISPNYFVVLTTLDGEFITNQTIEFKIKNQSYKVLTNEFGRAYLNIPLKQGSYEVVSTFNGSNNLTRASIINHISVYGNVVNLYSQNIIKSYNNATHYYVGLTDANNNPLANKIIKFHINGKSYEDITDSEGFACFEVWLNPGHYQITAEYNGEFEDEHTIVKNNITVLTTVLTKNVEKYWNGKTILSTTFMDSNNNPLANTKAYFIYNNQIYTIKTDKNGKASLNLNMGVGTHKIIAVNPNTYENKTFTVKILHTVISKNMVKYYGDKTKFRVKLLNSNGKLLKNTKIKITINKKTHTIKTNKNGIASLKINLKPGTYKIITYNTKTGEKRTNTITIKSTIITKNKVVKSSKKTNFKIKILNSKGKIIKNAKVKVKVTKKTYALKTNKKGIATLNIKLKKGTYKVISSYKKLQVTNKIKVVK